MNQVVTGEKDADNREALRMLLRREQIAEWVRPGRSIEPDVALRLTYDALYEDYLDLYRDSRQVVHRLAARQGTQGTR